MFYHLCYDCHFTYHTYHFGTLYPHVMFLSHWGMYPVVQRTRQSTDWDTNQQSFTIHHLFSFFNHHCIDNQRFKGAVYRLRDNFEMKLKRRNTERTVIDESCEDNGQKLEQASFSNLVQKEMEDGVKMEHKDGNNWCDIYFKTQCGFICVYIIQYINCGWH